MQFVRKTVRGSGATLLTLPAPWVRDQQITPGTPMRCDAQGAWLIVQRLENKQEGAEPAKATAPTVTQEDDHGNPGAET